MLQAEGAGVVTDCFDVFVRISSILVVVTTEMGLLRSIQRDLEFVRILTIRTDGDKKGYIMGEDVALSFYKSGKMYGK